jgi:ubiquitin C-terminal hydrolase
VRLIINHESIKLKEDDTGNKTLDECLNLFLEKEYLDEKDQEIYCAKCKGLRNFYKKYDIDRLPPVLVLTFKRFKFAKLYRKKINNTIAFPLYDFGLESYTSGLAYKYDLYGIIVRVNCLTN